MTAHQKMDTQQPDILADMAQGIIGQPALRRTNALTTRAKTQNRKKTKIATAMLGSSLNRPSNHASILSKIRAGLASTSSMGRLSIGICVPRSFPGLFYYCEKLTV